MSDPLLIHVELKRRESDFSKIARALSTKDRLVTPQNVRGVVYGISTANRELIVAQIRKVLAERPTRIPLQARLAS